MITHPFSLIPSFSDSLLSDRFNQIDRLFSRLTGDQPVADSPSYDIIKKAENRFAITVSVPGYTADELDVSARNGQLVIEGRHQEERKTEKDDWLHQGINRSNFQLQFNISRGTKVTGASLVNGLLEVSLEQEIPEDEKLKKIAIRQPAETAEGGRVIEHAEQA
ncbi:Hsp20 family protein [Martelella alba]|uniref:Hsp20 family protein n=1 Tax=Martelella alba TaxID=2590451 RepID=A0ABY2SM01_9HYPH|nr:Hsp20 family protein [Martelella alba]TKI06095.1 Hsp20 family protein [Martelella alba]